MFPTNYGDLGQVTYNGKACEVKRAVFSVGAATNTDVVAAVAGKAIRVIGLVAQNDGTTVASSRANWRLRSGTTDLINTVISIGTSLPFNVPYCPFLAQTAVGEPLNIIQDGGSQGINGVVTYIEV